MHHNVIVYVTGVYCDILDCLVWLVSIFCSFIAIISHINPLTVLLIFPDFFRIVNYLAYSRLGAFIVFYFAMWFRERKQKVEDIRRNIRDAILVGILLWQCAMNVVLRVVRVSSLLRWQEQESLALDSMARDDSPSSSAASSTAPASSTAAAMRGKVGSEFET